MHRFHLSLVFAFIAQSALLFSCKKNDSGTPNNPTSLPAITTTAAFAISSNTANSGGNITNDGGGSITARGVVWSTSQNPTTALNTKTIEGTGNGSFASSLTGLSPNTLYYLRAYATNAAGTAYGNQVSFTTSSAVTDIDDNLYNTVTMGDQVWMKENLTVSKYRNGDPITTSLSNTAWQNTTSGAYAIYNNEPANNTTYGKLYNWYAVADPRGLCPAGWHVPTDHDWQLLAKYLDPAADTTQCCSNVAGGKMKSTGTKQAGTGLWQNPNRDASNSSGFTGFPGGLRMTNSTFLQIGEVGIWWSSTESSPNEARSRSLVSDDAFLFRYNDGIGYPKRHGYSIRCLQD